MTRHTVTSLRLGFRLDSRTRRNPAAAIVSKARTRGALHLRSYAVPLVVAVLLSMMVGSESATASVPRSYALVTNSHAGPGLSMVDTSSHNLVATAMPTNADPGEIAVTPGGGTAYVVDKTGVAVIETASASEIADIPVPGSAQSVAITPDGAFAYVSGFKDSIDASVVYVISTSTKSIVNTITLPLGEPAHQGGGGDIAVSPVGSRAYVAGYVIEQSAGEYREYPVVFVIDTSSQEVTSTIHLPKSQPDGAGPLVVSPDGATLYVHAALELDVVDTSIDAVVSEIPLPGSANQLAVTPDGMRIYATSSFHENVSVVSTEKEEVIKEIALPGTIQPNPFGVAVTPDGQSVYVADSDNGLDVISTATDEAVLIPLQSNMDDPWAVAITPPIALELPAPPSPTDFGHPAPKVRITSAPAKETPDQHARFAFVGTAGGTFECSVDAGPWRACSSGQDFGPLAPGDHQFQVREKLNGIAGPAASYRWTIDLPRACVLKVARARVFAFTHQRKARLVIHYKAYKPARVTVSYSLRGTSGRLALGAASSHFKTAGIFRLGEKLDKADVAKLRATKAMKVRFSIPQAPTSCTRYYTKRLTIPKKVFGQTVWFQSDSIFDPKAK